MPERRTSERRRAAPERSSEVKRLDNEQLHALVIELSEQLEELREEVAALRHIVGTMVGPR
jgi:hypothetical protein